MAETGNRRDPFRAFRFEIRLDPIASGGFSECAGLQLETQVHEHPEGGLNTHIRKFPTRTTQSNITLKRGIVDRDLWDWYYEVVEGNVSRRGGSIAIHDPTGEKDAVVWELMRVFPCKWVGPDLNASQSSVAVETLELCHEGLKLQRFTP